MSQRIDATGMPPFFSVIIPAYNCAQLIAETLDSALAQTFRDFEIIVVDDGSADTTAEAIASYRESHADRVTVIGQQNKGEGGARNAGIFAARGQYLAFLDQDDLWFPWTLQTYHDVLQQNGFPSILVATGREFRSRDEIDGIACEDVSVLRYDNFFLAAKDSYLPAGTPVTVVKTSEAQGVGGLSEDRVVGIDMEFFWKLGLAEGVVHLTSPVTVAIRRHGGNLQKNTHMAALGVLLFIDRENRQRYPGGNEHARARRAIISRLARAVSMKALQDGLLSDAWQIYRRTLGWHIGLRRLAYVAAFPFIFARQRFLAAGHRAR